MFNVLHLVDLVMIGLVLHLPKFMVYYGFSPGFIFSYLSTGQEIGWKDMTYIVSSGTLNLNSIKARVVFAF